MERVLVSGASGPIGGALLPSLERSGADVVRLVRGPAKSAGELSWNPEARDSSTRLSPDAVSGFDVVIHLAGETVMGRWTDSKKKAILESRVLGTQNLASALEATKSKPKVFICASAVGFYGDRGEEVLTEKSERGQGFLPDVCREWEAASQIAASAGIRTVNVRFGLVLSAKGGALKKMLTPFKLGLGGRIGSGQQWWSWIHIDDLVGGIQYALSTESISGPLNIVGPNPVRNEEFTKVLASVLGRPAFFPVPAFALRVAFGQMVAHELFLASQRVAPTILQASGYAFQFGGLRAALESLI